MLTIPYLQDSADVAEHVSGDRFYLWMLAVCFVALGVSLAFQGAGNFQYLSEIAPAVERPGYFSTANMVLMFAILFPLLGAWILEGWDFQRLFAVSAAVALLAVLLSGILVDNRIVASRPAASTRSEPGFVPIVDYWSCGSTWVASNSTPSRSVISCICPMMRCTPAASKPNSFSRYFVRRPDQSAARFHPVDVEPFGLPLDIGIGSADRDAMHKGATHRCRRASLLLEQACPDAHSARETVLA